MHFKSFKLVTQTDPATKRHKRDSIYNFFIFFIFIYYCHLLPGWNKIQQHNKSDREICNSNHWSSGVQDKQNHLHMKQRTCTHFNQHFSSSTIPFWFHKDLIEPQTRTKDTKRRAAVLRSLRSVLHDGQLNAETWTLFQVCYELRSRTLAYIKMQFTAMMS